MIDKKELEKIKPGALVTVTETIVEGEKKRHSNFKGLVLARKHGNQKGATFTVRSFISGISVEKVYPINSPIISGVKVHSTPKNVKKSKLYFARDISKKKMQKKLGVSI
jgi:large subunit ribosomal protein L19